MTKDQHRKLIAKQLAKYYRLPDKDIQACACSGLSGKCLDCEKWWDMFLNYYSIDDIETMLDLFELCKARISTELGA